MSPRLVLLAVAFGLSGCGTFGPAVNGRFQLAVQETIAALPTDTPDAMPSPPAPTVIPLKGLFCEYEFCIGHPAGMVFFDVVAKENPTSATASTLESGDLAADNSSLFLEVKWQSAPGGSDGQFMLDVVMDPQEDKRSGDVQPLLVRNLDVFFVPIASTASATLPYGGAAGWVCGSRGFAWKAYATQPDLAKSRLTDALQVFRCD